MTKNAFHFYKTLKVKKDRESQSKAFFYIEKCATFSNNVNEKEKYLIYLADMYRNNTNNKNDELFFKTIEQYR